jgi:hypothetical protein
MGQRHRQSLLRPLAPSEAVPLELPSMGKGAPLRTNNVALLPPSGGDRSVTVAPALNFGSDSFTGGSEEGKEGKVPELRKDTKAEFPQLPNPLRKQPQWHWPCVENPDAVAPYPEGSQAAEDDKSDLEAQALYNALEWAVAA